MKHPSLTVHGFRSSFRDVYETTNFQGEVARQRATEQAYRRGDALEKRRELMAAWASYCDGRPANVIQLPARA